MASNLPPLPPGFQMQGATPAPPPGFQVQDVTSADGVSRNALSDQYYRARLDGRTDDANAMLQSLRTRGWTLVAPNAQQKNALFQQANARNVASQPAALTALQGVGQAFVNTGRGIGQMLGLESPQDVQESRRLDAALSNSNAGALGNFTGQAAQMTALGGVGGAALRGVGLAGRALPYVNSALTSGAFAGAQPVAPGENRAANAGIGAALGVAGEVIPGALGYAAQKAEPAMSAAKQDALATAARYNIPLHLNQVTDSRFLQTLGSAAKYLPFAGTGAADNAQRVAFNRALSQTIGQDAPELTPEVMAAARQANSNGYNALFDRNSVNLDDTALDQLANISQQAKQDLLPEHAQIVENQIGRYLNGAADNGGSIPGRLYQNTRGAVQKVESQGQPHQYLVGQVRKTMQDAANRSMGPGDAQALQALNGQYGNLKILDKALGQAQGANYSVTPANLWRLANTKYGATPEMQDLAQLGQTVLKDPIQNSGTAQRMLAYRLMEPGAAIGAVAAPHTVLPLVGVGATLGRLMNSPYAARMLPGLGSSILRGSARLAKPAPRLLPLLSTMPPTIPASVPVVAPQQ